MRRVVLADCGCVSTQVRQVFQPAAAAYFEMASNFTSVSSSPLRRIDRVHSIWCGLLPYCAEDRDYRHLLGSEDANGISITRTWLEKDLQRPHESVQAGRLWSFALPLNCGISIRSKAVFSSPLRTMTLPCRAAVPREFKRDPQQAGNVTACGSVGRS